MARIVVAGDVIIDVYVDCEPLGLGAETPNVVAKELGREILVGGAGHVARHLLRLGHEVLLLTPGPVPSFCGPGDPILDELKRFHTLPTWELSRFDYKHTSKTRFMAGNYKMFQLDEHASRSFYLLDEIRKISDMFVERTMEFDPDLVIICDNRHGLSMLLSDYSYSLDHKIPIFLDSQISQTKNFNNTLFRADAWFMNEKESAYFSGLLRNLNDFKLKFLVKKLGSKGSRCENSLGESCFVDPFQCNVVDTCGAGDAYLAGFSTAFCELGIDERYSMSSLEHCALIGSRWASESISLPHTRIPSHKRATNLHLYSDSLKGR